MTASIIATFNAAKMRAALALLHPVLNAQAQLTRLEPIMRFGQPFLRARIADLEISVPCDGHINDECMPLPILGTQRLLAVPNPQGEITFTAHSDQFRAVDVENISSLLPVETCVFPLMAPNGLPEIASIESQTLLKALALASHAISTEATRFYLNGVAIQPHPEDRTALIFAATDGHRLVKHIVQGLNHTLADRIIFPRVAVQALIKLLTWSGAANVKIRQTRLAISFESEKFLLTAKLIDGTFPDFERVIPPNHPLAFSLSTAALRRFCTRLGKTYGAIIRFDAVPGAHHVTASWTSSENGKMTLRLDGVGHINVTVGFQAKYIAQVLDAMKQPQIDVFTPDFASPTIFSGAGELGDPQSTFVIMPIRV